MDSQIKKRMVNKVLVHPFTTYSSGDKNFGEPIEINCIVVPHNGRIADEMGEYHILNNKVIFDTDIKHVITNDDEIEIKTIGRVPIKSVASYNSIKPGVQLYEVYC